MKLSDLRYDFPESLIAKHPLQDRAQSKMMVCQRHSSQISHHVFSEFPNFFKGGDVLVLNNSKVFPCRLLTQTIHGGRVEIFLVRNLEGNIWECLLSPSKRIKKGTTFKINPELSAKILDNFEHENIPTRKVHLIFEGDLMEILSRCGHIPLPPYLKREEEKEFDTKRYQTVFAQHTGSVAAPTAGFHLTDLILEQLRAKKVEIVFVTLHVGLGTFLPVRVENLADHPMHTEFYSVPEETAQTIRKARQEDRRISCVGTTVVRTLESAWNPDTIISSGSTSTNKLIYPPYEFKLVDRLLTNFHQPESTLLALVSAFLGIKETRQAYQTAIQKAYRLFSYGDCMWIS